MKPGRLPFTSGFRIGTTVLLLAVAGLALRAAPGTESDLMPLLSAAPHGLGPITLPGLSKTVLGAGRKMNRAAFIPEPFPSIHHTTYNHEEAA